MTLETGRPGDISLRQERERRTYDFLDGLGIEYQRADHAPAMTMEDCTQVDQTMGTTMCKNLFLCNKQATAFYLLMMPGEKKFRTKDLSAQIGSSRLSFANGDDMLSLLDIHPGSVSVLGLMNDRDHRVTLLVDRDLMKDEYLGCHPCVNTSSLKILLKDIWGKFLPATGHDFRVVDLPTAE